LKIKKRSVLKKKEPEFCFEKNFKNKKFQISKKKKNADLRSLLLILNSQL